MRKRLKIARQPATVKIATRFALIVGPILVMINHGDAILAGEMQTADWIKSAFTMLVPYIVSTLSSISACISCETDFDNNTDKS